MIGERLQARLSFTVLNGSGRKTIRTARCNRAKGRPPGTKASRRSRRQSLNKIGYSFCGGMAINNVLKSATPEDGAVLRRHMPELDSIRGLAILGVVVYHGLYWARDPSPFTPWQRRILSLASVGQFGVDLFFVLSGFLITGILLYTRKRPDYYVRFYYRRALRILPAYYLTLLAICLFGLTSSVFFFMSLIYCSNLAPLFGIALSYPVLWSLAVEEHFYLIWPSVVSDIVRSIPAICTLTYCWKADPRSIIRRGKNQTATCRASCRRYAERKRNGAEIVARKTVGAGHRIVDTFGARLLFFRASPRV